MIFTDETQWCQRRGTWRRPDGTEACCLQVKLCRDYTIDVVPVFRAVTEVIKRRFPERIQPDYPVISFNDHKDTTFEDVQSVLAEAGL